MHPPPHTPTPLNPPLKKEDIFFRTTNFHDVWVYYSQNADSRAIIFKTESGLLGIEFERAKTYED